MSNLSSKDIAAWHRERAKEHLDLATFHKKTADTIESEQAGQELRSVRQEASSITLARLERELEVKRGRAAHVALRLETTPDVIAELLKDPNSKYQIGDRGFIYPKK